MTKDTFLVIGGALFSFIYFAVLAQKETRGRRNVLTTFVDTGRLTQAEADAILTGKPTPTTEKVN